MNEEKEIDSGTFGVALIGGAGNDTYNIDGAGDDWLVGDGFELNDKVLCAANDANHNNLFERKAA